MVGKMGGRSNRRLCAWRGSCLHALGGILAVIFISWLSGCAGAPGGAALGAPSTPQPMGPGDFIIQTVWFFLLCLFIYWMMVLKPATLRDEGQKKFLAELKKNDEVLTAGGVFARVVAVAPEFVTLEISPNVRIRVQPSAVQPVPKAPIAAK